MVLPIHAAFLALRYAARKPIFLDLLKAGIVGRKLLVELPNSVPKMLRDSLLYLDFGPCHEPIVPFVLLVVKG